MDCIVATDVTLSGLHAVANHCDRVRAGAGFIGANIALLPLFSVSLTAYVDQRVVGTGIMTFWKGCTKVLNAGTDAVTSVKINVIWSHTAGFTMARE